MTSALLSFALYAITVNPYLLTTHPLSKYKREQIIFLRLLLSYNTTVHLKAPCKLFTTPAHCTTILRGGGGGVEEINTNRTELELIASVFEYSMGTVESSVDNAMVVGGLEFVYSKL